MTALDKYQRIEALGLWRADNVSQRKDVLISIGETTLLISDMQEQPLAPVSYTHLTLPTNREV